MNDLSKNFIISKEETKRLRKSNAIKLPKEIEQSMIPKYVVYYKECYNNQKNLWREFFKIEKHPKVNTKKIFTSSKSNKINIIDKLEEIKNILQKIEESYFDDGENYENLQENNLNISLPKYISLKNHEKDESKYYLIYDKKMRDSRITYRTLCSKNTIYSQNLKLFLEKIDEKIKIEEQLT
jgi:S-adenosylmethionine:tRNA-ribosyltransferase-isomerase (queuine synthetase)